MTFDFGSDSDDALGMEGFVSLDLDGNKEAVSYSEAGISAVPTGIKRVVSLKRALRSALKKALARPKKTPDIGALEPYNIDHLSKPDDFVVQPRKNITVDQPLPADYVPHDRWNFDKK